MAVSSSAGGSAGDTSTTATHVALLDRDGAIVATTDGWRRSAHGEGFPGSDLALGDSYLEVWEAAYGPDAPSARRAAAGIRRVLAAEIDELSLEYPWHSEDRQRWYLLHVTRLVGANGGQVVVTHRDITESKLHDQERRSLENQLIQARKMETLGQLATGVAHDFSNLLMVILGQSDLLTTRLRDGEPDLEGPLAEIRWAGERGSSLAQQLLAFGRKQTLEPRPLDVSTLLHGLEKMLARLIGEHIRLQARPAERSLAVLADPAQLEQAVLNLAVNARDAMPQGGELTIEAEPVELDDDFVAGHALDPASPPAPGAWIRIRVRDTGHGIAPEALPHIFEPFFTTKGRGRGTGLGLAAVYGILRQHGGLIEVVSEVGKGTTFALYLPRCEPPGKRSRERRAEPLPRGTETLLLVEDDERVRRVTRELLESLGYRVLEAEDHRSALEWATRFAEPIHLLLTDVVLPGKNGPALAAALQALRPDLEVLYMSGYTGEAAPSFAAVGAATLLRKPVRQEVLAQAVRRLLDTA